MKKHIVFTQYTDTMDYLRENLQQLFGSQVACYSGRGGELYQEGEWRGLPKEEIKKQFRDGTIKILLCTESASEGLNLQTCGVLINYDLPWNPMRVEQRIGRIDRIWELTYKNKIYLVTFYPEVFDEKPSLRLMNLGEPLFQKLLETMSKAISQK